MEYSFFGIKTDAKNIGLIAVFLCACLIMTGHFIYKAGPAAAKGVSFIQAGRAESGGAAPGSGATDGGTADGVVASGVGAGKATTDKAAAGSGATDGGAADGGAGGNAAKRVQEGAAAKDGVDAADANLAAAGAYADDAAGAYDAATGTAGGTPGAAGAANAAGRADPGDAGEDVPVRDGYLVPSAISYAASIPDAEKIYVYVTGAVKKPGVYALPRSSMVIDAIERAGGFTAQADAENVNMVFRLESNAMLNVKRKPGQAAARSGISGDSGAAAQGAGKIMPNDNPAGSELYGSAVEITYDSDDVLLTGDNAAQPGDDSSGAVRININAASAKELESLPGIGKATADKIIEYRSKQKFTRIEDLMKVNGIKQAKFDALKDYISCS